MNEFLFKILTFGMNSEQGKGFLIGGYRMAVMLAVFSGWGWFSFIGLPKFALASDVTEQIKQTQNEVLAKLKSQEAAMNSTVILLNRQLAAGIASQIRVQAAKRCKARDSSEREQANREIDKLQEEYLQYRQTSYSIPGCEAL